MGTPSSPHAPAGGEVVPGGWDYEHCEIYSEKIGVGGEPEGYFSPPSSWICVSCYENFVVTRSLAFVPNDAWHVE